MQKNLANRSLADSKQQRKKVAGCGPRNSDIVAKESGRGQPHSKTLARGSVGPYISRVSRRSVRLRASVLECGCPLPLSSERSNCRNRSLADSNLVRCGRDGEIVTNWSHARKSKSESPHV